MPPSIWISFASGCVTCTVKITGDQRWIRWCCSQVQAVGLDAGYATAALAQGLEERGIYGVTGYRRPNHGEGLFSKHKFRYDAERDVYVCPNQQQLEYRTTNRQGYRQYHS